MVRSGGGGGRGGCGHFPSLLDTRVEAASVAKCSLGYVDWLAGVSGFNQRTHRLVMQYRRVASLSIPLSTTYHPLNSTCIYQGIQMYKPQESGVGTGA